MNNENQWVEHIESLTVNEVENVYFLLQWLQLYNKSYNVPIRDDFINFNFIS